MAATGQDEKQLLQMRAMRMGGSEDAEDAEAAVDFASPPPPSAGRWPRWALAAVAVTLVTAAVAWKLGAVNLPTSDESAHLATVAAAECVDTDNGVSGSGGYSCDHWDDDPTKCHKAEEYYDDTDFTATEMCCACNGGHTATYSYVQVKTSGACCRGDYFENHPDYAADPSGCEDLCNANPRCVGFDHSTKWENCHLCDVPCDDDGSDEANYKLYTSWAKITPDVAAGYTKHADTRTKSGNQISEIEDATVTKCANACNQEPACVAFTMNPPTCKLKSKMELVSGDGKDTYEKDSTPAPTTVYQIHDDHHCGGQSITTWASGESEGANYGQDYVDDVEGCKTTCSSHSDCAGFVLRDSDERCSFWKSGPLSIHSMSGHHCYEKVTKAPTPECHDAPFGWVDTLMESCDMYVSQAWCNSTGGVGDHWVAQWGGLEDYSNNGHDATQACCGCGGGKPETPEWPQYAGDFTKCEADMELVVVESQAACQAKAVDAGAEYYQYAGDDNRGSCVWSDKCTSPTSLTGYNWKIYSQALWPQFGGDHTACDDGQAGSPVDSQASCQANAVSASAMYYQYAANSEDDGGSCSFFPTCPSPASGTTLNWKVYSLVDHNHPYLISKNTRLTASKSASEEHVFWAGEGKIYEMHWGQHNGWKAVVQELEQSTVNENTILTSSRKESAVSVFWPGNGTISELHWGEHNGWDKNVQIFNQPGITMNTHLSACKNENSESVFWASKGKIYEMHWGTHNGWKPEVQEFKQSTVEENTFITSSKKSSGISVFWPGNGKIYELHWGDHVGWDNPTLDVYDHSSVSAHTRLTACKSDIADSVFWAGEGKIYEMHWGTHNGWNKQVEEITQSTVDSDTILTSSRKTSGVSVFWPGEDVVNELHWGDHNQWDDELVIHEAV